LQRENSFTNKEMKMSKDKGSKNHKKAPADKTKGKIKPVSAYKSEGKSATAALPIAAPKVEEKSSKSK
jgi:hypothetical protein